MWPGCLGKSAPQKSSEDKRTGKFVVLKIPENRGMSRREKKSPGLRPQLGHAEEGPSCLLSA